MSEAAPEGGRPRGGGQGIKRPIAGVPLWGWIVIIGAGAGTIIWLRLRGSKGSTATATDTTAAGTTGPADTTSEYEQLSAELTGIEGTQAGILAAIKDLQGDDSSGTGSGQVKVPDIVGERAQIARAKIASAGLVYKQEPARTPRNREARVTSQSPSGGTKVAKGSEVTAQVKVEGGKTASAAADAGAEADTSSGGGGGSSSASSGGGSSPSSSPSSSPTTRPPAGRPPRHRGPPARRTPARRTVRR